MAPVPVHGEVHKDRIILPHAEGHGLGQGKERIEGGLLLRPGLGPSQSVMSFTGEEEALGRSQLPGLGVFDLGHQLLQRG